MLKTVLINQPAGLGDILFCQKIGEHYKSKGHRVIWPVIPEYRYVGDYLKNFEYPVITSSFDGDYFFRNCGRAKLKNIEENKDYIFHPSDKIYLGNGVLVDKYIFSGIDVTDWINYINIQRNEQRETELFNILGLKDNEEYCLVNRWFASPPHSQKMYNVPDTKRKIVEMNTISGFTLFDWMKVIENASEFFVTDSSLTLLVELLRPPKAEKFTILLRQPDIKIISFLYKLNWKYVEGMYY